MFLINSDERLTRARPSKFRGMTRLLALGLILVFAGAGMASADDQKKKCHKRTLTGTWMLSSVIYGEEKHGLVTFFSDGTLLSTSASKNNNNAHGVWKKIGPRTFFETNREFLYRDDEVAFFGDTTEVIELSEDGMSYVGEAFGEVKLFDGTVVGTVSFTIYGTRMTTDF